MTVFIVSGYMRSATSCMMQSLIAGGMDADYSKTRTEEMNAKWGEPEKEHGYLPNSQYFELDSKQYKAPDFPKSHEGKLIKCLWGGVTGIGVGEYRCIFMRRPKEEIKKSLVAFFGNVQWPLTTPHFDDIMDRTIGVLRDRGSYLSVDEIWFEKLLADPLAVFEHLKSVGWPIDPVKAAAIPSARKKRFTV